MRDSNISRNGSIGPSPQQKVYLVISAVSGGVALTGGGLVLRAVAVVMLVVFAALFLFNWPPTKEPRS